MGKRESVTRRSFLEAHAAVGAALAAHCVGASAPAIAAARTKAVPGAAETERPRGPVIDCHAHLTHHGAADYLERDRRLIEAADKLGIDRLCCSLLAPKRSATAKTFRECNVWMAEGMKRFRGRVLAYCYVNPGAGREATDEIRRCVEDRGFMGIKLYNAHKCTDPVVFPVVELAIELRVPILHHAGHGHRPIPNQPNISDGGDLAELARRYPEACLICAHIGGGGDWEWTIKALRHAKTVFLDTAGSVTDEGVVEMAAEVLGVDRLLFACDNSMTAGVGRMRSARLSPEDKQKILGDNMARILARRG